MRMQGGSRIRLLGSQAESSAGCLVRFAGEPGKLFMLGAAHGLVRRNGRRGDEVESADAPGTSIGRLWTWSTFYTAITAEAALILVSSERVSPAIRGLGRPAATPNVAPRVGMKLQLCPRDGEEKPRNGRIAHVRQSVTLPVTGPDWYLREVVYADHIICEPMFTRRGDSGAVVLDEEGRVVGMVVAGRPLIDLGGGQFTSQSVIAPIASILNHPDFEGRLEIVADIPGNADGPD